MTFKELLESGLEMDFNEIPLEREFLYKIDGEYVLFKKCKHKYRSTFSDEPGDFYASRIYSDIFITSEYKKEYFCDKCILLYTYNISLFLKSRDLYFDYPYQKEIKEMYKRLTSGIGSANKKFIDDLKQYAKFVVDTGVSIMSDICEKDLEIARDFLDKFKYV